MCDQTQVTYKPNDVVWVKLSNVWWPAQVQDQETLDELVTQGLKKKPLAVVKFFNENYYEFIKNLEQIYHYNCLKKNEFIQKGLDMCRPNTSRSVPSSMIKFPDDVRQAELITGGNPDICDDPMFKGKTEDKMDTSGSQVVQEYLKTPKSAIKRAHNEPLGEPSRKQIRFSLPTQTPRTSDAEASTSRASSSKSASRARSNQRHPKSSSASISPVEAKPVANVIQTPVRPISQEVAEKIKKKNYQANIRIQPNSKLTPPVSKEKLYTCFRCYDTTNRLSLLIDHYRAHEQHGMNVPPMSPNIVTSNTPSSTPGPSREVNLSTPKVKSEKHKANISRKPKSDSPIKKKAKRDETPRLESVGGSNRTPSSKKKQKKSKSKHSEIDQNKVLREKILKDWDDESDEEISNGSKVFSTTAEIHASSTSQMSASPSSPQIDSNTAITSTPDTSEMETTVSSTNDLIVSDNTTLSKNDFNNEEILREDDVRSELTTESLKEEGKSCFDFEDNDEVINLDKSHKFGQKLPRVINEEKVKKSAIQSTESETTTSPQDLSEDDSAVLENKIQELLEVTKVSEIPYIPNTFLPKKLDKKKEETKENCGLPDNIEDRIGDKGKDKSVEDVLDDASGEIKEISNECVNIEVPEKNECEISNIEAVEKSGIKDIDEVFSTPNEKSESIIEVNKEENEDVSLYDSFSENKEADNEANLSSELRNSAEKEIVLERILDTDQELEIELVSVGNDKLSPDRTCKDDKVIVDQNPEGDKSEETVENNLEFKENDELGSDKVDSSQGKQLNLVGDYIRDEITNDNGNVNLGYVKEAHTEDDDSALEKYTENIEIDLELLESNKTIDVESEEKKGILADVVEKTHSLEVLEVKEEEEFKEIEMIQKGVKEGEKEEMQLGEIEEKHISSVCEVTSEEETVVVKELPHGLEKEEFEEKKDNVDYINVEDLDVELSDEDILKETKVEIVQERPDFGEEVDLKQDKAKIKLADADEVKGVNEMIPVKEVSSIDNNNKKDIVVEEDTTNRDKKDTNTDLLNEENIEVESVVEQQAKEEKDSEEYENKLWRMEMDKTEEVLSRTMKEDSDQSNITKGKHDLLSGKTFVEFDAGIANEEIEISTVDSVMSDTRIKEENASGIGKEEKSNYLVASANLKNDIDMNEKQITTKEIIVENEGKKTEEMETSELKASVRSCEPSNNTNLQKNLTDTEPVIKVEKYYSVPELGTYNNELMNVSSSLHQWTAMEYYADLEAQVRNDTDVEETKTSDIRATNVSSSLSKETFPKEISKDCQERTAVQNQKELDDTKVEEIENSKKLREIFEGPNRCKQEDSDILSKGKSPDCSRSGVIYDFKLDFPEQTVNEIPIRVSKIKKRKWESKDPSEKGDLNDSPNAILTETKSDDKGEELAKNDDKSEESSISLENAPRLDYIEVASKKLKLDMDNVKEPTFKDDQDAMSTEVREEITISQDSGVMSEEIKEIIVSTSEETLETSTKASEITLDSSKITADPISVTLPFTSVTGKENLTSERKLQLNLTTTSEKTGVDDKKETSSACFDPSQIELDINSMPVVIEEDLIQDIKLPSTTSTVNPPTSTRTNMKQIRIQLRKAGENNSSLLQGTQNGRIIRIPGTSKEPIVTKKTQLAGTSKMQTVSNLLPQRTVTGSNQTVLLKMNPIQNSGQTKYTVGKSQIRTTTALTTSGASGQPLKLHIIQQTQQQNTKLITQPQQKQFTGKLTSRVLSKSQATTTGLAGGKPLATKTGQKLIINQKRHIISSKNIIGNTSALAVTKSTTITQKNAKSVMGTKTGIVAQPTKNVVLPAVQGTSGTTAVQVVSQAVQPKVIMQRRTKSLTGTIAPMKTIPTQASTIFIHTSQGLVPASKTVTKQILNQIPQISAQASPRPATPTASNLKRPPMNKSRQANINILQRSQKKNNRQQGGIQTPAQQQGKQQVLSIPVSSIPSHELILNNVPVQFQNIGTAQSDVKMLYLVDEHGQYHQVDNSPLIAIDNSGENRSVFIESNSANEVDNLFLTFGEPSVVNVTTSTTTPSQDILAKALANTQVLQSDTTDMSDTIEGQTLYVEQQYPPPTLTHNVLETSFSLNPPIMTPLEVPSSVAPQVTTMSSNLLPATTVVEQTIIKKADAQPSMPLLTDDVEVATGQAVYLDSSTLVPGTSQPLTFQVINSDGNIVVASAPTSSSQTITNPVNSNKTSNQVIYSTDLLKSESHLSAGSSNKAEHFGGNVEDTVTSGTSDLNIDSSVTISLESNQQEAAISVDGGNRQIIQTSKISRARDKRSRTDSTHNNEKQIKNIVELGEINKQDNLDVVSSESDEILQKRLQQDTLLEKTESEEKPNTQQSRTGPNNKTLCSFTYAQPILSTENESKFTVEEKR